MTLEREPIDRFLDGLEDKEAAVLRAAATEIDDLSRQGADVAGIERRFVPWTLGGIAAFVAGLVILLSPPDWFYALAGGVGRVGLAALLGFLPGVGLVYLWRVRHRTRADRRTEEINRAVFAPAGALYFAETRAVVRIEPPRPPQKPTGPRDPRKNRDTKPGWIWWPNETTARLPRKPRP